MSDKSTEIMKSKEVWEFLGISRNTLYKLDRDGILQPFRRTARSKYYHRSDVLAYANIKEEEKVSKRKTIVYYRVSTQRQKDDLKGQLKYLENYVSSNGIKVDEYIKDIGSGINYKKPGLKKLIRMIDSNEVDKIIIAYKDRLVRFGFEMIEYLCELHGTKIEIINLPSTSPQEELVNDLMTIIHVFSSRLYGLRKYKKSDFLGDKNEK